MPEISTAPRAGRWTRRRLVFLFAAFCLAAPAAAQEPARGTLHIVWDAGAGTSSAAEHWVVDAAGRGSLLLTETLREDGAELLALDRTPVELRGHTVVPGASDGVTALRAYDVRAAREGALAAAGGRVTDDPTYDFVTVLCRFPDDPTPAFTRADVERAHGGTYPGVRNFFAELSWDAGMMSGSRVTEWYTLPRERAEYVSDEHTEYGALARDCTDAAESDVDFPAFFGINLQFSNGLSRRSTAPFDTLSFGGSWSLTLNGVSRSWGVTWLSAGHAGSYVVLKHEIGHALGWPHSSGGYGDEFDSEWDVMSRGYARWEPPHGWLGVHTISQHKDAAGWVPADRRWTPEAGAVEAGMLVRTALPPQEGYLFARIPAGDDTYYTAEARRLAGHDQPLPGEAVVLHHVRHGRGTVVDVDTNGNPNDAGAQWKSGEEFHDSVAGISLRVDSASASGFHVRVTRGWRMDMTVSGPGRIIGNLGTERFECAGPCTRVATERGASVIIEAAPDEGAVFSHWEGACSESEDNSCTLGLRGNRSVEAVFTPVFAIIDSPLAPAVMGAEYVATLTVTGAPGAVAWAVSEGSLPPGLTLDPDAGAIRGIPTAAGEYAFTLAVRAAGAELNHPTAMSVVKPTLRVDGVIDQLLAGQGLTANEVRFLDLAGNRNGRLDVGDVRRWFIDAGDLTAAQRALVRAIVGERESE